MKLFLRATRFLLTATLLTRSSTALLATSSALGLRTATRFLLTATLLTRSSTALLAARSALGGRATRFGLTAAAGATAGLADGGHAGGDHGNCYEDLG